ncbi:hypothetical protein DUI87_15541 [Hirundo rustica rustica]|uniref:Integrase catalytic domain-containing protein n=1 Tax=Hirundo rustica rustica TaxID=333673 RepID=A0A3M0KLJ1_HIRRU|nr:hypothetical protein DUI87_15541 [Hirundo rustica rustica]
MWASALTGEKTRNVIAHWRQAFAILGIPSAVKTDNGPTYASQKASDEMQSASSEGSGAEFSHQTVGKVLMTLLLQGTGMHVYPEILGYTGYLQSVFVLTCDRKGKIQPIGKLETVIKMKVIKWMW